MSNDEEYNKEAEILEKWLKDQNELPKHMERILLRRYVHACDSDVEKAKELIRLGFEYRTKYEHIFIKRDPLSPEAQLNFQVTDMIPLPICTHNNQRILIYRLADFDPNKYDFNDAIRGFFMVSDTRLMMRDPVPSGITSGEIPIFDMNGCTLRHITKVVLSTIRIYLKYIQEAYPVRPSQIHMVNCSPYLDRLMVLIKPFLKSEVFKMIHFHLPNSTTLYEHIPLELLPTEYGGKAGNIADMKKKWVALTEANREYLTNEDNWRIKTENKKSSNGKDTIHIESFNSLCID